MTYYAWCLSPFFLNAQVYVGDGTERRKQRGGASPPLCHTKQIQFLVMREAAKENKKAAAQGRAPKRER